MADYVVYGDLNCPFSYALFESLSNQNLLHQTQWRMIEHKTVIGSYLGSAESMAELASDIFSIRNRVPDIAIALPLQRGDSYFPTLCVIAAQLIDPEKAMRFLRSLYRALWVEGKDISNPSLLFYCLEEAGLPTELETDGICEETLNRWQQEWEQGGYNLRTPALQSSDGRRMVGLLNRESVISFLGGEDITPVTLNSSSRYQQRMTIAIFGGDEITDLSDVISSLRDESNILLPQSLAALQEMLTSEERCPDLILLYHDGQNPRVIQHCQAICHPAREKQIPLAVIGEPVSDREETAFYDAGAADYIQQKRTPEIILARINVLLQLKRSHDLLARAARIDTLTQVYNRREFERCFETEWRRGQRSRHPLSLILLDIDHFKAFNDHQGHLSGDNCLRQVAQAIKTAVRRVQDVVSRYGGEEFAILLPETDLKGAAALAEGIRKSIIALDIRHSPEFSSGSLTASLGVACAKPSDQKISPRQLLEQADSALYRAKDKGRNRTELYQQ